jgi:hypothetical protein
MTRAYNTSRRRTQPMQAVRVTAAPRDPDIATIGFSLWRLVGGDEPVRLLRTTNAMGIFAARAALAPRRF